MAEDKKGSGLLGMIAGPAIGSIVGGAMGLLQKDNSKKMMEYQAQLNEEQAQRNHARSKDMWNYTSYPNQKGMMEQAGLNPALMYGQAGAGGQTAGAGQAGSVGLGEAPVGKMGIEGAAMGLQLAQLKSQIEVNESIANLNNTEAEKKAGVDTDFTKAQIWLSNQQGLTEEQKRNVMEAETKLKSAQEWLTNSLASTEQFNLQKVQKELNVMDQQLLKLSEETKALKIANKINAETAETQVKQYYATLANTLADTVVKAAQGTMYEEEAGAIGERIRQGNEVIEQGNQRIVQDWVKVGIQGAEALIGAMGTLGKLGKTMKEIKNFGKGKETHTEEYTTTFEGGSHKQIHKSER